MVELPEDAPAFGEAVPLKLQYCHTRLAVPDDAQLICERFADACAALGGDAELADGRVRFRLG